MTTPKNDHAAIWQLVLQLQKAGWNPTKISDPESVDVRGMSAKAIATLITSNYFSALLNFDKPEAEHHRKQWVYFVLGNAPEEVACDYTVGNQEFDAIVTEITESWDS